MPVRAAAPLKLRFALRFNFFPLSPARSTSLFNATRNGVRNEDNEFSNGRVPTTPSARDRSHATRFNVSLTPFRERVTARFRVCDAKTLYTLASLLAQTNVLRDGASRSPSRRTCQIDRLRYKTGASINLHLIYNACSLRPQQPRPAASVYVRSTGMRFVSHIVARSRVGSTRNRRDRRNIIALARKPSRPPSADAFLTAIKLTYPHPLFPPSLPLSICLFLSFLWVSKRNARSHRRERARSRDVRRE